METKAIIVEGIKFVVPSYYQQVDSEPEDPVGSMPLMAQTGQTQCLVLVNHIADEQRMPTDQDTVIEAVRGYLNDNQGIIEINSGALEGMPYIYSIVKNLEMDGEACLGAQYILSMEIAAEDGATHFQGQFDEVGMTGMRDALAFELCRAKNLVRLTEDGIEGWSEDPYNPEWTYGALMNLSEKPNFDKMFPDHPLSMVREFVNCVLGVGECDEELLQGKESRKPKSPFDTMGKFIGSAGRLAGGIASKAADAAEGAAGKFAEATGEAANAAGDFAGKAADVAGDAAGKFAEAAGEMVDAAADAAGGARDAIGEKVEGIRADKELELDEYDLAVIDYNLAYTDLSDAGLDLFHSRERSIDLLGHVENLVNSIANRPKSFDRDFGDVSVYKKTFKETEEFAKQELSAARKSAAGVGAGVAAGMAVASMAPSAAIWVATTFGTASTGTAISTLSGAAASQAALAWLGGGALAAGGGGTAAGSALLAMAGPIGWGIAGATLLTSIVLFAKKKHDIRDEKQRELSAIKENTERVAEMFASVHALIEKTNMLRNRLSDQYEQCVKYFGSDYVRLDLETQDRLATMVNNTLALAQLLNERVMQGDFAEE